MASATPKKQRLTPVTRDASHHVTIRSGEPMSDWYTESRQNRQLEELRDEMSRAVSEASNLRSRMSQLQGGLETRLEQLTDAFDAFVELSDIRYELIGFAPAAELRRHAGQVLAALASGEQPPEQGRDVAGYWLQPATAALRTLADQATAVLPEGPLSEALGLDERRTSIFLCLALAALGRRDLVQESWLHTAFGTVAPDGKVTRVQRALWTTAARGGFGAEGGNLILERLRQPLSASTKNWLEVIENRAKRQRPTGPKYPETSTQIEAQARLAQVGAAIEAIAGDTAVREPDSDLAYGEPTPDSASAVLRMLISEGSEPEREPLVRAAELRARVTRNAITTGGSIADSAGTVEQLLAADLKQSAEPHLAATALRVIANDVLPEVEALAKTASGLTPTEVTYDVQGHRVTLRADGLEPRSMEAAAAKIESAAPPLTARALAGPLTIAIVGLAVGIGLGILHWFWIIVGLAIVGYAARRAWQVRATTRRAQADANALIATIRNEATEAAAGFATYKAKAPERQKAVEADLEVIRKYLA